MGTIKRLLALCLCVLVLLPFMTGCNANTTETAYVVPKDISLLDSGVVASNDNFELEWDKDLYTLLMKNKKTGEIWSTVPYDSYLEMREAFDEEYQWYEEDKEL
jgi:hypothetical protein